MIPRPAVQYMIPFKHQNLSECLIGILENARMMLIYTIYDVEMDELDWIYAPGWNSIGMILAHLVSRENWIRIRYIEKRELNAQEFSRYSPAAVGNLQINASILRGKTLETYDEELQQSRETLIDAIKPLREQDLVEDMKWKGNPHTFNLFWHINHLAEDELSHRGQIMMIRKLYKMHQSNPSSSDEGLK